MAKLARNDPESHYSSYISIQQSGIQNRISTIPIHNLPDEISDTGSANYSEEQLIGRSSGIVSYISTGFREVSFSFDVHREDCLDDLLKTIRASVYPSYNGTAGLRPTITTVRLKDFYVRGITRSYSFTWKKPIINGQYQVCSISMTIAHITNKSYSASDIVRSTKSPLNPFS